MRRRRIPRDCAAGADVFILRTRCVSVAGEPCHWHVRASERLEACVIQPRPPLSNLHAGRRWTGTTHYHRYACANGTGELHRRAARAERPTTQGNAVALCWTLPASQESEA
jgi:hypothetical protein